MLKILLNCLLIFVNIQTILKINKKQTKLKKEYQSLLKSHQHILKFMEDK